MINFIYNCLLNKFRARNADFPTLSTSTYCKSTTSSMNEFLKVRGDNLPQTTSSSHDHDSVKHNLFRYHALIQFCKTEKQLLFVEVPNNERQIQRYTRNSSLVLPRGGTMIYISEFLVVTKRDFKNDVTIVFIRTDKFSMLAVISHNPSRTDKNAFIERFISYTVYQEILKSNWQQLE